MWEKENISSIKLQDENTEMRVGKTQFFDCMLCYSLVRELLEVSRNEDFAQTLKRGKRVAV